MSVKRCEAIVPITLTGGQIYNWRRWNHKWEKGICIHCGMTKEEAYSQKAKPIEGPGK